MARDIKEYRRGRPRECDDTQLEMALIEYARNGGSATKAERVAKIHHKTIQRAWDALTQAQKDDYTQRAQEICDCVEKKIFDAEVSAISEVASRLKEVSYLALDELTARLKDDLRRMEMKDADLIAIVTKSLTLLDEHTRMQKEQQEAMTPAITNIFNILDNSIQANINNQYKNERQTDTSTEDRDLGADIGA